MNKCVICEKEVTPSPKGYIAKTCGKECLSKHKSNTSRRLKKEGKIFEFGARR